MPAPATRTTQKLRDVSCIWIFAFVQVDQGDLEEDLEEKFEANEDEKQFEIHQNDQELEDTNEDLQVKEEELEIEPDIPLQDDFQGD